MACFRKMIGVYTQESLIDGTLEYYVLIDTLLVKSDRRHYIHPNNNSISKGHHVSLSSLEIA